MRKKRVLFMAEAVTLAHVARPFVLARGLDSGTYDVHFARHPRFDNLFPPLPFHLHQIRSIPSQDFANALAMGRPVYKADTLENYVTEDLELMREVSPDVVVGDFRLSLAVSARLRGIPYLTITNAYWSPYARLRFPVPELPLTKILPVGVAQCIFTMMRPLAFAYHGLPLNRVRRNHSLASLGLDLRNVYTHADHTLYVDIPELFPVHGCPANHHYLGPIIWSPNVSLPIWWDTVAKNSPLVYLTLGSSGAVRVLPVVLEALAKMEINVIASTAGRIELENVPPNVFTADYLPGEAATARAELVICNGGSPATQQALAAGVPVLGIASNMDQHLNMQAVRDAGAGERLRSDRIQVNDIQEGVARLLAEPRYAKAAQRLARQLAKYHAASRFEALLRAM